MSQSTLDDDLFDEAASEVRADVEEHLAAAREELPDPEDVWEIDAENALGVLNGLRSALDVEAAREHFRDAKKWYTMGERAGAFEDAEDLAAEIEDLDELLDDVEGASEQVGDLAGTLPDIRKALRSAAQAGDADEDEE